MAANTLIKYKEVFAGVKPSGKTISVDNLKELIVNAIISEALEIAQRCKKENLVRNFWDKKKPENKKHSFGSSLTINLKPNLISHSNALRKLNPPLAFFDSAKPKEEQTQFDINAVEKILDIELGPNRLGWAFSQRRAVLIKTRALKSLKTPEANAANTDTLEDKLNNTQIITLAAMLSFVIEDAHEHLEYISKSATLSAIQSEPLKKMGFGQKEPLFPNAKKELTTNPKYGFSKEEYAALDKKNLFEALKALLTRAITNEISKATFVIKEDITELPELEDMIAAQTQLFLKLQLNPRKNSSVFADSAAGGLRNHLSYVAK